VDRVTQQEIDADGQNAAVAASKQGRIGEGCAEGEKSLKRTILSGPATAAQRMQALGRLKVGTLNKTGQAYEALLKSWQHAGLVVWFKFEGVKLRLADNTFYTPDFAVMLSNGQMEMHEVKGARAIFADDAKVKVKIAAELYPFPFVVAFPVPKNRGGGWEFDRYE
jgi:hypothetical protein